MYFDFVTWHALGLTLLGALAAGFTTGFAGFGTGLVAAGFWLHALPPAVVPPMVAIASVTGQCVGLVTVRRAFSWHRAWPFLLGGFIGLPFGILALQEASPGLLRAAAGGFLIAYAAAQLSGLVRLRIGAWGGRQADGAIGFGGGVLGGFAGLSGPLPLVWLQLRGLPADQQRATYQPFNLFILAAAALGMAVVGHIDRFVLFLIGLCLPATLLGAWLGALCYRKVDEPTFRTIVLALLLLSGLILVGRTLF